MPLYTYECDRCGDTFTDLKKINDRDEYVGIMCGCCPVGRIRRIPDAGTFKINGFSEANGYSNKNKK